MGGGGVCAYMCLCGSRCWLLAVYSVFVEVSRLSGSPKPTFRQPLADFQAVADPIISLYQALGDLTCWPTTMTTAKLEVSRLKMYACACVGQTMVNSISYVLDDEATLEVSTAWTNIGRPAS